MPAHPAQMFSIAQKLNSLPEAERALAERRIRMVHAAQQRIGMMPRDDSQLTYKYAIGELEDDVPSSIANELMLVDKLHKETQYAHILEPALRELASVVKNTHRITWTETWSIVRFYGPTMLKLYCARSISDAA